jgi:hypothetical protein
VICPACGSDDVEHLTEGDGECEWTVYRCLSCDDHWEEGEVDEGEASESRV